MIVLGIDTSTSATAAALRLDSGETRELRDDPAAGAHPGHATRLLTMIDGLLTDAAIEAAEVERIAVGAGPGTFTGLRVGIASARALAQSLGAELVAVSSLRALARPAEIDRLAQGRAVLATIDARRGEVFAAPYDHEGNALAAPRAIAPDEIARLLAEAGLGPEGEPPLAVGDGALRYRAELERAGALLAADESPLNLLRAGAVCELAVEAVSGGLAHALPDYLRRPDAEITLEAAAARSRAVSAGGARG